MTEVGPITAVSAAAQLARLEQTSKLRLVLLALGFASILACLGTFLFIVDDQRAQAEHRAADLERTANELASTLEQVRAAYARDDFEGIGNLLPTAIVKAETIAQSASVPVEGATPDVAPPPQPTVSVQPSPPAAAYQPLRLDPALNRRVFVQFAGSIAREDIAELNRTLRSSGWSVEGGSGERTVRSAGLNEVRYRGDEDREAAQALADAVTLSGVSSAPLTIKRLGIISPGTLEVWMSK